MPTDAEPSRLDATAGSDSVYIEGNRPGLYALADVLQRGSGRLRLDAPVEEVGPGSVAMSAVEITACDGLIVVSSHEQLLRIDGSPELLDSVARAIGRILAGAFWSAHFEPQNQQGLAPSSVSFEIALTQSSE